MSAGNTGALLVISRLIIKNYRVELINQRLQDLWPNQNSMNVVLDLGANIECNEKNLVDFACMGSALFKSLFDNDKPKVAFIKCWLRRSIKVMKF